MKQKLSLLEVCGLPDVQLHSKTAFLKSIIKRESAEAVGMRDEIVKLSYTVKTIGVHGEQVGITSKRLPLKNKHIEAKPAVKPQLALNPGYVPHQSFFSQPLVPVRSNKPQTAPQDNDLQINSNGLFKESVEPLKQNNRLKARSLSTNHLKSTWKKRTEDYQELGRVQGAMARTTRPRTVKKSFSEMLRDCRRAPPSRQSLNPLLHEENPLFKKIVKIRTSASSRVSQAPFGRYSSHRALQSSNFTPRKEA